MRCLRLLTLVCSLALSAQAPLRQPGVPTLQPFCTWTYVLKGARYGEELYFVDMAALKRQGHSKKKAVEALRHGDVAFARRMTFLIEVSGAKRRELLEALLKECWPSKVFPSNRQDVKAFLDWQGRAFNQGDNVEYVFAAHGPMWIRFNSQVVKHFKALDLTQAMRTMLFMDLQDNPGRMEALEAGLQSKF
jgi:hypothetical protein